MTDGPAEREGRPDRSSPEGADERSSWAEHLLMVASAVFTVLLFAYVIWQGATTPVGAAPTATVVGTERFAGDEVKVTVAVQNPQDVGLVMVTVRVGCDAQSPELVFEHVPADDRRRGYAICPRETENPTATVSTWTEA